MKRATKGHSLGFAALVCFFCAKALSHADDITVSTPFNNPIEKGDP